MMANLSSRNFWHTQMKLKNKSNRNCKSFFFYKRCASLLCLLFVFFVNAQMFVGEGTMVSDKENSIVEMPINTENQAIEESVEIKSDAATLLASEKIKNEKPKSLVTKKEIIQKKIEKQAFLHKNKKTETLFIPNGEGDSTIIFSGTPYSKSAITHQTTGKFADISAFKFLVLSHTLSSTTQESLSNFTYKNSVAYFFSVRPPPPLT